MAAHLEQTIAEKLKALYDLQQNDAKINQIQVLKGELPIEVQELEDELKGLETRYNNIENAIKDFEQGIAKYRSNIKEAETLIMRYESQQDNVKNNREYEALMKEVELQKLEIQLGEKRIKTSGVKIDEKKAELAETSARVDKKREELDAKRKELARIIAETEIEEREYQTQSNILRQRIEERLLRSYDKIRSAYRNGLAVVTIERNACGGCFNKTPAQVQLEIAQRKKITACEHCGRILVDDETAGKVTAAELSVEDDA
jgi:predicted  nucleic acid-binding Zn-ribbon protein